MQLQVGHVYRATPESRARRNRFVAVIGRQGDHVQLAWIDDLTVEPIRTMDDGWGSEFCQARPADGGLYTVSAACEITNSAVRDVVDLVCRRIVAREDYRD